MSGAQLEVGNAEEVHSDTDFEVLIVGAGFGGIGAAIELIRKGVENFLILDKNDGVGGVWRVNTYPGVAADLPFLLYSYSYAPPRKCTRFFPTGAEVREYIEQIVDDYRLTARILLNTNVAEAVWEERSHKWTVHLASGETLVSRFLICGIGPFSTAKMPDIPGIEDYQGKVIHTAQWDHDFNYSGNRIAVIGNGASGLQLIPELADIATSLVVFQRRPTWVAPKPDFAVPQFMSSLVRHAPLTRVFMRAVIAGMVDLLITGLSVFHKRVPFMIPLMQRIGSQAYFLSVRDRELSKRLTPEYAPYCKAVSISNRYLRTFTRDHVELVTVPIEKLTARDVVTRDGTLYEVDVLVCATGFKVMDDGAIPSFPTRGRNNTDLHRFWQEHRFQAYQGVSVPNFPNLFLITGPYAYPGGSWITMIECTSKHAARAIAAARARGATAVEIRSGPHDRYWRKCLRRARDTIWLSKRCAGSNSYVVDNHGDPVLIRPSLHCEMWWGNKRFPLGHYAYSTTPASC
ncbi:flavin-containing monooxygenase [Mycobacterium kansasii]